LSQFIDPIGLFRMCVSCAETVLRQEYIREIDEEDLPELCNRVSVCITQDTSAMRAVASYLAARGLIDVNDLI
jgi:hypothetical protein